MKKVVLFMLAVVCLVTGTYVFAASGIGIGSVASNVTSNLSNLAKAITGVSYVAGLAFAVGAIVKFKAHKDNPTQIPIGTPIALLFVGAALLFTPALFKTSGQTLFGTSGVVGKVSGITSFMKKT